MADDNNSSGHDASAATHNVETRVDSTYIGIIILLYGAIGIKYQGVPINPFKESTALLSIFLIASFCHIVALKAGTRTETGTYCSLTITSIITHLSGASACQALMWVLVPQLLLGTIINLLMLLVATMIFYKEICQFLIDFYSRKITGVKQGLTADIENQNQMDDGQLEMEMQTYGIIDDG